MLRIIIWLLFSNKVNSIELCSKSVYVRQVTKQFIVSFPFPKIVQSEKNTNISISCELYSRIKVGDLLLSDQVKDFNLNLNEGTPHGTMTKHEFTVLQKD